jgi:hypothetical protein
VVVLLIPPNHGEASGLRVELMAREREQADAWMREVRTAMDRLNAYRGKVIAFGGAHPFRPAPLEVRRLPEVPREAIVLPDGTLERIERHTVGLSQHKEVLRAQGRHVKRGLLLHGPPGTGKTLTVMYLASLMPDRTTLLLTGGALQLLGPGVALARSMEPATIVIEDVDLVALDRSHVTQNPLLFELLDAMDGLDDDADLIFVLTTNRVDVLEPALASRPGRIDLAVELPLPDAAARRRLLELYARGMELDAPDWDAVVQATDGTSAAFARELMRRAALGAAETGTQVGTPHLLAAVEELRHTGGRLTASLLGAERPPEVAFASDETIVECFEDDVGPL